MACRLTKDSMMTPCPGSSVLSCSAQCACVEAPALIVYGPVFRSLLRGQIFAGISLIGVPRNVTTTTQHDFPTNMVALSSYHHKTSCSYALLSKTFQTARYSLLKYMTSVALVFDIAALGCSIFD